MPGMGWKKQGQGSGGGVLWEEREGTLGAEWEHPAWKQSCSSDCRFF